MKRNCLALSLIAVLSLVPINQAFSKSLEEKLDFSELEKVAIAELQEKNAAGAAVAVVSGDRVIFAKGFGLANVETDAPVTPDTLFQIGSITKTFTAAAVLTLAEEGKL